MSTTVLVPLLRVEAAAIHTEHNLSVFKRLKPTSHAERWLPLIRRKVYRCLGLRDTEVGTAYIETLSVSFPLPEIWKKPQMVSWMAF